MKDRELYTVKETRVLLGGISNNLIYDLLNSGELSSLTIGRRRLIPAAAISSFIAANSTRVAPSRVRAMGIRRATQMPLKLEPPPSPLARRRSLSRGRSPAR